MNTPAVAGPAQASRAQLWQPSRRRYSCGLRRRPREAWSPAGLSTTTINGVLMQQLGHRSGHRQFVGRSRYRCTTEPGGSTSLSPPLHRRRRPPPASTSHGPPMPNRAVSSANTDPPQSHPHRPVATSNAKPAATPHEHLSLSVEMSGFRSVGHPGDHEDDAAAPLSLAKWRSAQRTTSNVPFYTSDANAVPPFRLS